MVSEARYRFEERAAIIEYDGKRPRDEAEQLARGENGKGFGDDQKDNRDSNVTGRGAVRARAGDRDDGGGVVGGAGRA